MLTDEYRTRIAQAALDMIDKAEVMIDGVVSSVPIIHKSVEGDLIKLHTQTGRSDGILNEITLKDAKGQELIKTERNLQLTTKYSTITTFAFRVIEHEMRHALEVMDDER